MKKSEIQIESFRISQEEVEALKDIFKTNLAAQKKQLEGFAGRTCLYHTQDDTYK